MVATGDEAIPPDAERQFAQRMGATTVEVASGHLPMVTHPDEVVKLIEAAARSGATPDQLAGCRSRTHDRRLRRAGTFADEHRLAVDLATAVMRIKQVPDIPMFRKNTAAFVHDLLPESLANVDGDGNYVRVQVLTNAGALDRAKQLAAVRELTDVIVRAAGDATLADRTRVLLTEAPDGGWGLNGHANTNAELVAAAREAIATASAGGWLHELRPGRARAGVRLRRACVLRGRRHSARPGRRRPRSACR
jgi:phenylpyruvate tautomerase PptA (4-oxalocrotonate tautomerase family)